MTFSTFTATMNQTKGRVSPRIWNDIRRRGIARVTERLQAGYGDEPLTFSDLYVELEQAMIG